MKRLSLLLPFLAVAVSGFAQQRYISLHSNGEVSVFGHPSTAFADAYNAAQSGDTLYLPGGLFTPPGSFTKGLAIYGAGHYPDSTQATGQTFINGNVLLKAGSDNFYLEGLEITGFFQVGSSVASRDSVENITVTRCKINGNIYCHNGSSADRVMFIQSVLLGNMTINYFKNTAVSNCILQGRVEESNQNVFENNIFLFNSTAIWYNISGNNNVINNNIFLRVNNIAEISGSGNLIHNNITIRTPHFNGTGNDIQNNYIVNRDDLFINQENHVFDYSHDYHLQTPETYRGADGTQVGIYGGTFPYKGGAVPSNPHISSKFVAPRTDSSGELQVEIRVNAQDGR